MGRTRIHPDNWREWLTPQRIANFWAKVSRTDSCWLWTGSVNGRGYGTFHVHQRGRYYAHRFAYRIAVGEIPAGLELDHLCKTHNCVRPDHLEPVPHAVNVKRGLGGNPTCKRGHPFTEQNTRVQANGRRRCRECHRIFNLRVYRKLHPPKRLRYAELPESESAT